MVLDPEPKEVTLAYAGQEVSVTTAEVGFVNERQKVEISLKKCWNRMRPSPSG